MENIIEEQIDEIKEQEEVKENKSDEQIIEENLNSFYNQMGYSKKGTNIENMMIYPYKEVTSNLLENEKESKFATKFNIRKSDINVIMKAITQSAAYQRTSQKSMMATRANTIIPPEDEKLTQVFQDSESLIQTRQTHMREVAEVAAIISDGLGTNTDLAYLTGLLHDIGHTWNGHSGERILSAIARYNNCGYIAHNAMGAYIIEREKIIDDAIEEVKQFNPKADENELKRFMKYVIDGIVSHNGEGTIGKVMPQDKNTEQMAEEIRKCFTEKSYDKKIMPATLEGAIIRYADILAYTRSDILDGFRLKDSQGNKIIDKFDDDYLSIIGTLLARKNNFTKMLDLENKFLLEIYKLSEILEEMQNKDQKTTNEDKEEIERLKKEKQMIEQKYKEFEQDKIKYAKSYVEGISPKSQIKTKVTTMMQNVFIMDLIEASKDKGYITMSPLIRRVFFSLRDLNIRKIVPYTRRDFESRDLPIATKKLVENFRDVLLERGYVDRATMHVKEEAMVKEEEEKEECDKTINFERKLCHYYDRLSPEKMKEIYENCERAITEISKHDVASALGEEEYEGELKDIYDSDKIMHIKSIIGKMGITGETITKAQREIILKQIIQERSKDINKSVASKMAIEYIGGMTDNTILTVLIDKNLISRKQLIEGYGRAEQGKQIEDKGVTRLQKEFAKNANMIVPDNGDEDILSL